MKLISLDSVHSTSSHLATIAATAEQGIVVAAREQTAGRGQRGNSWEAEPGKNLTFSLLLRPAGLRPARQFLISKAVAVALARVLSRRMGLEVRIKWPNDLYVADRKICGVLIESVLSGMEIERTIVGVGINVNQTEFRSDAPNPVSMAQLTGHPYPLEPLLKELVEGVMAYFPRLCSDEGLQQELERDYHAMLWRREGFHPYRDNLKGTEMRSRIVSVAPTGMITLEDEADGTLRTYAFKEISALLR